METRNTFKIDIDKEAILKNTGIFFEDTDEYIYYIQRLIDYLYTHNKNYTKKQYNGLIDLFEIITSIKATNDE